jgi:hypothetical protein
MPTPPNFLIAVFGQPIGSFDKWISRGVNALVSHETQGGQVTKAAWEAAAIAKNLFFMDYPSEDDPTLQNEAKQTHRLAFMQDDEPDLTRDVNNDPANRLIKDGPYKGWTRPELLVARYQRCKAAAPNLPVFCNFAGPQVTPDAYTHGNGHKPYLAACDWVAHDWYVKNKNADRYSVTFILKAMSRLEQWWHEVRGTPPLYPPLTPPQFVFIECSDQDVSTLGRAPTPDEMEEEIALAVERGARGIVYFPQKIGGGFSYDAIPPDLLTRMTAINQRLNARFNAQQPTHQDLLNAIEAARADIASRLDALANRGFQGTVNLNPV